MTYAVKEIYYTLQGEGANSGRAAVFLRFSGCNLWTGLEKDRHKGMGGCSMWCDTNFVGTDGTGGGKYPSATELVNAVSARFPSHKDPRVKPLVVCTGGEPLLQLDEKLVTSLTERGLDIAVETNGTIVPPHGPLWITVSPKAGTILKIKRGNELKLVFPQRDINPSDFLDCEFEHFFLQPLDNLEIENNTKLAIDYCLKNPQWRLSYQMHKAVEIP
jgi:7-carboxy-7-deazaguanine synthase (Cx14CxxC type)